MKKLVFYTILACALFSSYTQAAQGNHMSVCTYQVEREIFCEVTGCIPGSDISLYSQKGGGVQLFTGTTDAAGKLLASGNTKFTPAFALSRGTSNRQGIKGNGKVCFTGIKEFTLTGVEAKQGKGSNTISFNAAIHPEAGISFEIFRSEDGRNYTHVATLPGLHTTNVVPYIYTEPTGKETAFYQVRVVSNSKGLRYTANLPALSGTSSIVVYPSVIDNDVQITLPDGLSRGSYRLLNSGGQIVRSGDLTQQHNSIVVGELPAGIYIMVVQTTGYISRVPVVKK